MAKQIFSTGADSYEIDIPEEVKVAEPAVQQPIEIKLKTGEVIKAQTYEDALKVAIKMAEDSKDWGHQEKEARERLESQVGTLSSQVQQLQKPPQQTNGFDKTKYYALLNDDPIMAQNYVDAHRFGLEDPAQVPGYFRQMANDVSVTRQESLAASFLQQHSEDFPPTGAPVLRKEFETLIAAGYPATLDTLNMAYGHAVDNGTIKPLEKQQQQQREEPNPSLRGEGDRGVSEEEAAKVDKMSDKDLEAYLRSKGLL